MPGPYRLLPADGPSAVVGDTTAYTLGVEFYVTTGGLYLYGFEWWCAPGADQSAKAFQLFECVTDIAGTAVDGGATVGGPLLAGHWNYAPIDDPVLLVAGQHYRAGVLGGGAANWYSAVPNAWPADVVDGPLVGVATTNALGGLQGSFNTGSTMSYPRFVGNGASYGIDVVVSEAPASALTGRSSAGIAQGPVAAGGTGTTAAAAGGLGASPTSQGGAPT